MATTNFYEELLNLLRGITGITAPGQTSSAVSVVGSVEVANDIGSPLPVSIATSPIEARLSWRVARKFPSIDGATGSRVWTPSTGREWQLIAIGAKLTTGATAGNRLMTAQVRSNTVGGTIYHSYPAGAVQTASSTVRYSFALGEPYLQDVLGNPADLSRPLPPLVLADTEAIWLFDQAQISPAGDTWADVSLLVLERVVT